MNEVLGVILRAIAGFFEMLKQALFGLVQRALWILCLLAIGGAIVTGTMALVTHRGDVGLVSLQILGLALLSYVSMSLVAHFRYPRPPIPPQDTETAIGRDEDGRISLPPLENPWR